MNLKINDNDNFNLSLTMRINYDMGYVEFIVTLYNKINSRKQIKVFDASKFDLALKHYNEQERMFMEV